MFEMCSFLCKREGYHAPTFSHNGKMLFEMCLCLCKREIQLAFPHGEMILFEMHLCLSKRERVHALAFSHS